MRVDKTTVRPVLAGWCPISRVYEVPYTGPHMVCGMNYCLEASQAHYYQKRLLYICPVCAEESSGYLLRQEFLADHDNHRQEDVHGS